MQRDLIIVFTCHDRPGVIEQLTEQVVGSGGSWQESRLARLAGDFAGLARVSVPQDRCEGLTTALRGMQADDFTIHVRTATESGASIEHRRAQLSLRGADHEGIVNRICGRIAAQGINVDEMTTSVEPAPTTGTPVFTMHCSLELPAGVDVDQVADQLSGVAGDLGVEIEIDEL